MNGSAPRPAAGTRLDYLSALDIPVWVPRVGVAASTSAALAFGPGSGARLFVCADRAFSATPLAADIERCLPEPVVWAWPDDAGQPLETAVQERLLTSVAVFGDALAAQLWGGPPPRRIGTAQILLAAAPADLAARADARRELWRLLRRDLASGSK